MSATQSPVAGPPVLSRRSSSSRHLKEVANAERDGLMVERLRSQGKGDLAQRLVDASDDSTGVNVPGRPSHALDPVKDERPPTVCGELKTLVVTGLPLGFSHGSRLIQELATSVMLGRFNTTILAAVMLSSVWSSFLDNFWMSGIGQLAALSSQAYGAGSFGMMGIWLQIFLVFGTLIVLPVMVLRYLTEPILLAVGIESELAHFAQMYTAVACAAVPTEMWYFTLKEWYASRLIVIPDAVVDGVFIFVRIGFNYVFIFMLDMGIQGAGIAYVIVSVLRLVVYVLYTWSMGYAEGYWHGWKCSEFCSKSEVVRQRWKTLAQMTVPAMIGGIFEELQFQVVSLMAGRFGEVDSAALQLVINIVMISFMLAMAGGDIVGIRMAKFLGEGRPDLAKFVTRVGVAGCFGASAVLGVVVLVFMPQFAQAVSQDPLVQDKLVEMRWATGICIPPVSVFIVCAIVLEKQGRAYVPALLTPLCCWACGFPCSIFLANSSFHHGASGLWDGVTIGYIGGSVAVCIAWHCSDWQRLSDEARRKAEVDSETPSVLDAQEPSRMGVSLQPTGAGDGAGS